MNSLNIITVKMELQCISGKGHLVLRKLKGKDASGV